MSREGRQVHFVVVFSTQDEEFTIDDDETAELYRYGQVYREVTGEFEPDEENEDLIDDTASLLEHLLKEAA